MELVKPYHTFSLAFLIFLVWTIRESNPAKFIANDFRQPWNIIAHSLTSLWESNPRIDVLRTSVFPLHQVMYMSTMKESNLPHVNPNHARYRNAYHSICGGEGIRTLDLLVMSQTSCQLLYPAIICYGVYSENRTHDIGVTTQRFAIKLYTHRRKQLDYYFFNLLCVLMA